jgi:hypothetical protein
MEHLFGENKKRHVLCASSIETAQLYQQTFRDAQDTHACNLKLGRYMYTPPEQGWYFIPTATFYADKFQRKQIMQILFGVVGAALVYFVYMLHVCCMCITWRRRTIFKWILSRH